MLLRRLKLGCCAWGLGLVCVSLGCTANSLRQTARDGSLTQLATAVEQRGKEKPWDRESVEDLAQWVAEREILSAGDPHGDQYLELLEPCARALGAPLSERAKRPDETGAQAWMMLVRAGEVPSDSEVHRLSLAPEGSLRAVGAAAATRPSLFAWRRQAMLDPDPRVRRAALFAASSAPSRDDRDVLIDTLRRDPDPVAQDWAIQALAQGPHSGTDGILDDVWRRGDQQLRTAITKGYARASTQDRDAAARLLRIAEKEEGVAGTLAALALLTAPAKARWVGLSRLAHDLVFGTETEQLIAIRGAYWNDPAQRDALRKLASEGSGLVRVAALEWFLATPENQPVENDGARQTLLKIASEDEQSSILARQILATHGELRVVPLLERQQGSTRAGLRALAARGLWALARRPAAPRSLFGVARALADDAPDVRLVTACLVLKDADSDR